MSTFHPLDHYGHDDSFIIKRHNPPFLLATSFKSLVKNLDYGYGIPWFVDRTVMHRQMISIRECKTPGRMGFQSRLGGISDQVRALFMRLFADSANANP